MPYQQVVRVLSSRKANYLVMPVREVSPGCFQWGDQKIYCGKDAKKKAHAQGRAIIASGWKEAEYQPNQTLGDYDDEGLTHSSTIEGYQPFKYSVMTSRAETLSKTSCCCGADESNPCICMKQPEPMQCSAKEPMCPCYKELAKAKMKAESTICRRKWCKETINPDNQEDAYGDEGYCEDCVEESYYAYARMLARNAAETFNADSKEEARLKKYVKTYGEEGAKVRNRIFKRILANAQDGTKAGQWSARKAQSLTEDYEKAMAKEKKRPYKSSKKTKSQKSLKDWGDQDWRTKSGKKSSKTGERYLPAKAIDALTDEEYKKTSAKKRKDMKQGKQFSDQPKTIAKKTAKFRNEEVVEWDDVEWNDKSSKKKKHEWQEDVEWGSESTKPSSVEISRSSNPDKKLMAVFYDSEGKKLKTTHFGQRGASDYTKHGDKERMERYLERHGGGTTTSTKEDWKDPTTAGSLSRWILWNKPDLEGSFKDYLKRFNLKGDLKVSKSAEEVTILAPIFGPTVLGFVAGAIIAHIANR